MRRRYFFKLLTGMPLAAKSYFFLGGILRPVTRKVIRFHGYGGIDTLVFLFNGSNRLIGIDTPAS